MPPPVITTVPFAGCGHRRRPPSAPPSTSVSLASTSIAFAAESSATVAAVVDRRRRVVDTGDRDRDGCRVEPPLSVYVNVSGEPRPGRCSSSRRACRSARVPPPVIATVPFAGSVTDAIDLGPPSTSVSFASTAIALAAESSGTRRAVVDRRPARRRRTSTVTDTVAGRAAVERVRERVRRRRRPGRCSSSRPAHRSGPCARPPSRVSATVPFAGCVTDATVIAPAVDCRCRCASTSIAPARRVLADRRACQSTAVGASSHAGHRHRDRRRRAAVERVRERVRRRPPPGCCSSSASGS